LRSEGVVWMFTAHGAWPDTAGFGAQAVRVGYAVWYFSVPLWLLALSITDTKLFPRLRDRRTDPLSFEIFLFWTVALSWLDNLAAWGPFRDADMMVCLALLCPLLFRHIDARDFLFSRTIRWIFAISMGLGALATVIPLRRFAETAPQTPFL